MKKGLKKIIHGSFRSRLAQILFAYRLTPQTTTGLSPSELLLGRRPRSRLDLLKPHAADRVENRQATKQVADHNKHSRDRSFKVGDLVFVRNYRQGDTWLAGEVLSKTGPVSYQIRLDDNRIRRCHVDQIRSRSVEVPPTNVVPDLPVVVTPNTADSGSMEPSSVSDSATDLVVMVPEESGEANGPDPTPSVTVTETSTPKVYPRRQRKTLNRYDPSWS